MEDITQFRVIPLNGQFFTRTFLSKSKNTYNMNYDSIEKLMDGIYAFWKHYDGMVENCVDDRTFLN